MTRRKLAQNAAISVHESAHNLLDREQDRARITASHRHHVLGRRGQ